LTRIILEAAEAMLRFWQNHIPAEATTTTAGRAEFKPTDKALERRACSCVGVDAAEAGTPRGEIATRVSDVDRRRQRSHLQLNR
jgi:hypothetical protein